MTRVFILHRGRQQSVVRLFRALNFPDYHFDFRPYLPPLVTPLFFALKTFLTSYEIPPRTSILICEGSLSTLLGISYKLRCPSVKIITYVVDPTFWIKNRKSIGFRIRAFLYKHCVDHIVAISPMVQQNALQHGFVSSLNKTSVIELPSFREPPNNIPSYTSRSFATDNIHTLLYMVDRPHETGFTKGLDIVIQACSILSSSSFPFRLYLAGKGSDYLSYDFPWLQKLGHISNPDHLFSYSDLFILPSRYDAGSIALLESVNRGLLPLASTMVGYSSLLASTENHSLVVPHLDPTAWANYIQVILNLSVSEKDNLARANFDKTQHISFQRAAKSFRSVLSSFSS